ncbi:aromatic ring-opening dioxygenase LigA [Angustibacter sp. McL0619]|uniref:aromatic ring-opening dioxygenase LigA n=1 Tax=Angustibacter sp. McL0619 TaxID=3415676 RepID=UPI003CF24545
MSDLTPTNEPAETTPETTRATTRATTPAETTAVPATETTRRGSGGVRVLGVLVVIIGLIFVVAGVGTYITVANTLADEHITVSEDADHFAGDDVDSPWTAYAQANTIEKHALEAGGGKTYAELDQDDPKRSTVMTASFLRASLFTSVVAFGVAFLVFGLGITLILVGWALIKVGRIART